MYTHTSRQVGSTLQQHRKKNRDRIVLIDKLRQVLQRKYIIINGKINTMRVYTDNYDTTLQRVNYKTVCYFILSHCDFRHADTSANTLAVFSSTTSIFDNSSAFALKFFASSSFKGSKAAGFSPCDVVAPSCNATFEVDERLPGPPFTKYPNGRDSDLLEPFLKLILNINIEFVNIYMKIIIIKYYFKIKKK